MKEISNRISYFMPFLILWIGLAVFVNLTTKPESFTTIQITHTPSMNILMQLFSDMADGIFLIVVFAVLLLFIKIRFSFILLIGFSITGIFTQVLKNTIYKGEARPVKWYEQQHIELKVPEGLKPHSWNSFPSGHSATAACLFTFLAFRTRKHSILLLCAVGPFLAGYSRIYLYHHFPADVLAGLAIGLLIQLAVERVSYNWFMKSKFDKALLHK